MFIAGGFRTVKTCLVLPENSGGRLGNDEGEHQMASRLIKLSCAVSVGFAAFSAPGLATECANKDEIVGLFTKWDAAPACCTDRRDAVGNGLFLPSDLASCRTNTMPPPHCAAE